MALVVRKKFANAPQGDLASGTTYAWVPLTTTNAAGDPVLVWNADDTLVMTLSPMP